MGNVLVSVVMPVFDAKDSYLEESLRSMTGQTFRDFELLVVEDKGRRDSGDLVKRIGDPRITYILNEERNGFAGQLNQGVELARGEYVARMDSDDVAHVRRLEKQVRFLEEERDVAVLGSNLTVINEAGRRVGTRLYPERHEEISRAMRTRNAVAHSSVMVRRSSLLDAGGYEPGFGMLADYDLWARMLRKGMVFHNLQEALLSYRIHARASKMYDLKAQLKGTIKIKDKYFRKQEGWNIKCELWYIAEKLLSCLPRSLVYWLFVRFHVKS